MNIHTDAYAVRSMTTVTICGITTDEIAAICDEHCTTHEEILRGSRTLLARTARRKLLIESMRRAPHLTPAYVGRVLLGVSADAMPRHIRSAMPLIRFTDVDDEYLRLFPISARDTVIAVSVKHGIPVGIMMATQNKTRIVVNARQELIWRLKTENPDRSFPKIAGWFEQDHTTILNGFHMHSNRIAAQAL